jgi:hypothetical protein
MAERFLQILQPPARPGRRAQPDRCKRCQGRPTVSAHCCIGFAVVGRSQEARLAGRTTNSAPPAGGRRDRFCHPKPAEMKGNIKAIGGDCTTLASMLDLCRS